MKTSLPLDGMDILVAEDSAHMRAFYRSVLEAFGARRMREAEDGAEAYAEIRYSVPDILLTDYGMSPVDGAELTGMLRNPARSPAPFIPILMVTAYTGQDRIRAARDAGVHEVLHKPVSPQELVSQLARIHRNPIPYIYVRSYFGPDRRRPGRLAAGQERRAV